MAGSGFADPRQKRISTGEVTCIENRQLPGGSKWQLGNWATMRQDEQKTRETL